MTRWPRTSFEKILYLQHIQKHGGRVPRHHASCFIGTYSTRRVVSQSLDSSPLLGYDAMKMCAIHIEPHKGVSARATVIEHLP